MRNQSKIYIQNENGCVRNKDITNVSTSSDICVFSSPLFTVSGATKVMCNELSCSITGNDSVFHSDYTAFTTNYTTLMTNQGVYLSAATATTCFENSVWVLNVYEDSNIVYSGTIKENQTFSLDFTNNTFTENELISAYELAYTNLKYVFNNDNGVFTIKKPYGVENLYSNVDFIINVADTCVYSGGSPYSGTQEYISASTVGNLCSLIFDTISTGDTGVYILNRNTENIDLTFVFTGITNDFSNNNGVFSYEIYKYNNIGNNFIQTPLIKKENLTTSTINSAITESIAITNLNLDGDYLVKLYFKSDICTDFLNRLGKKIDTLNYKFGKEFLLYNKEYDFYFIGMYEADKPEFLTFGNNLQPTGTIIQEVIIPEDNTGIITANYDPSSDIVVTLNGLTLSNGYDYTVSGNVITLSGATSPSDIITVIYTNSTTLNIRTESIFINTAIPSGTTNNQGSNLYYYNTTTGHYEIYLSVAPINNTDIIVMLNGATLANGLDFYQSTSNPKRIILNGNIFIDDLISIFYYPQADFIGVINTNEPVITWLIENEPIDNNGLFTLEVSTATTFNNFYYTGTTNYVSNQTTYNHSFIATGQTGTNFYYRVKNSRKYRSICGDIILDEKYSDIIPFTITTNSINSY